ncbi:MAG: hypothetical protein U5K69_17865 [Balneolaceae bacterium]|nr:hypothetical protein [Balneolaceae bacterium]
MSKTKPAGIFLSSINQCIEIPKYRTHTRLEHTLKGLLIHRVLEERDIELAIFKDHRYSFFDWLKWTCQLRQTQPGVTPTLVTIDWHRDLAPPSEDERMRLNDLNQQNLNEVREFTLNELDAHNDGHLLSAAWLNLIGDVILLKNYGMDQKDSWMDGDGQAHLILEFKDFEAFSSEVLQRNDQHIYLDIDLDYFIHNKVSPYQRKDVQVYSDERIKSIINPKNQFFQHLLPRLEGITLAREPRYCGGVRNSNHILDVILNQLFTKQLEWKTLAIN